MIGRSGQAQYSQPTFGHYRPKPAVLDRTPVFRFAVIGSLERMLEQVENGNRAATFDAIGHRE